jgi:hypothetical protein
MFIAYSEDLAGQDRCFDLCAGQFNGCLDERLNVYLMKHAQVAEEAGSMSSYRLKRQTCSNAHPLAGPLEERSSALTQGKYPCLYLPGPGDFPINFSLRLDTCWKSQR